MGPKLRKRAAKPTTSALITRKQRKNTSLSKSPNTTLSTRKTRRQRKNTDLAKSPNTSFSNTNEVESSENEEENESVTNKEEEEEAEPGAVLGISNKPSQQKGDNETSIKEESLENLNSPEENIKSESTPATVLEDQYTIKAETEEKVFEKLPAEIHSVGNLIKKAPQEKNWSVNSEILLLKCIAGSKPAGLHKHFRMACICNLFNKNNPEPRSAEEIWNHLNTMYDMQAIDEIELESPDEWSIFPSNHLDLSIVRDFELPPSMFKELMDKKIKGGLNALKC